MSLIQFGINGCWDHAKQEQETMQSCTCLLNLNRCKKSHQQQRQPNQETITDHSRFQDQSIIIEIVAQLEIETVEQQLIKRHKQDKEDPKPYISSFDEHDGNIIKMPPLLRAFNTLAI
jgi:hypothetical protein